MLAYLKDISPIIIGLLALYLTNRQNKRTLKQHHYDDERKEIYKKLNSFYGPLSQLRGISSELYKLLKHSKDINFRTLDSLLMGHTFEGNDKILLEQILDISKKIDNLIIENSGLIEEDMQDILAKAGAHFRILQLAYEGNLKGEISRFENYVFPRDLDVKIKEQVTNLNKKLNDLNNK